jgi:NAD(P)-dependent dehydrogenase (short-subunit alcohol dehydrogenase family)
MSIQLDGKVAFVTGASRGLGQKVALKLAGHGARVALVARNEGQLRETEQLVRQAGGLAQPAPADISDPAAVTRLQEFVSTQLGAPAILINAAGIFGPIQLIKESDPTRWVETMMINAIGPYLMCRAFVGDMLEQGWGRIVNFTSAASLHPPGALNSAYATSKVALNQFTRHLAAELAGSGVTANVIHPGDVKTDMWADIQAQATQAGPIGEEYLQWTRWVEQTGGDDPGKAAELVLQLMSDQAASTTGQFLWIEDGLQAPIPSWTEPGKTQPWRDK